MMKRKYIYLFLTVFVCSVMAVMAGLNNASINRLREDWSLVSAEKQLAFANLEKLLDPSRNFRFSSVIECVND
jgi:hypothetical protein